MALIAVVAICLLATPTLSSPVDAKLPGIAGSHEHLGVGINYPNPRADETSAAWRLAHMKQSVPISRPPANNKS
ncbi:hypothetical protein CERSUDRAFT_92179 [Gelatoporia subvermispora B]|uniref:Secreted protein n=1 Tax=Ceriporiopsis subvermispora (strain B) TaxID=914234 RepID=M2PSN5_CERS8|nr:hypothetical protein CERSUDRAFT_92179 [Gelatoporia subvermispora B]